MILSCNLIMRMCRRHLFRNVWSFLVVVLVTLYVFWLLSWLLFMSFGCCLGYFPCFLVVVLVTLHVFWLSSWLLTMSSGCCLGYSPCLLVIVLVTLHVSELYSNMVFTLVLKIWILFLVEKDGVFHSVFKEMTACLAFPILLLTSSTVPPPYCSLLGVLSSVYLFSGLSSLLPSWINWLFFICICLCVCESQGHPIV